MTDKNTGNAPSERHVRFRSRGTTYFLPAAAVDGVVELPVVHRVPGGPPGVLGVCSWNGRIYTVVDPSGDAEPGDEAGPAFLIRLAPPLARTALRVRGPVETGAPAEGAVPLDLRLLVSAPASAGHGG